MPRNLLSYLSVCQCKSVIPHDVTHLIILPRPRQPRVAEVVPPAGRVEAVHGLGVSAGRPQAAVAAVLEGPAGRLATGAQPGHSEEGDVWNWLKINILGNKYVFLSFLGCLIII